MVSAGDAASHKTYEHVFALHIFTWENANKKISYSK